jgi:signal transduction histidine kinase
VLGNRLKIIIADSGPGIPQDVMPHIFEPLYSTKSTGVGLGLSVVKGIIEQHGGRIKISSKPGKGVKVIVLLPLTQC